MRLHLVRTVLLKELREALRDRRTLFMMVGLPILLYPMLMFVMSRLQESQEESQKARVSEVAVWGTLPAEFEQQLTAKGRIRLKAWNEVPSALRQRLESGALQPPPKPPMWLDADDEEMKQKKDPDTPVFPAARDVILARKADAVLVAWPGFTQKVAEGGLGTMSILYDSVRPESVKAKDRLNDEMRQYRVTLLEKREKQRNLETGFATGIEAQLNNVAPPSRKSGMFLGMILPYMLILFSAMSGFYAAIDMTAGEKERGTMQTLLCAPLEPLEIMAGKFGAIWTISILATIVNLLSLAATFSRIKMPGVSMAVSPLTYIMAFPMVLPITLMVTGVLLAVGAFAKDFKEGQNFLTPVLMSLVFPLMATMTPGIELNPYLAFVPIINVGLMIKSVFLGDWHAELIFLVTVSSLCYALLALVFASSVFERNNLLLGGKESMGGILDFRRREGARPTPATSLLAFSVMLVASFYGSLALEKKGPEVLLPVMEIVFIALPAILLARAKGFDFGPTFSLRMPSARVIVGAVLIGLSGWTFATGVVMRLLPPPESLVRALEKVLMVEDKSVPLWEILLLVAVLPAVCEELLFRGMVLSGFRRLGMWTAIVCTALLFGVAHASIYRMGPVTFLGLLFGYLAWKSRSVVPGMIAHALNNGLMMVVSRNRGWMQLLGFQPGAVWLPWMTVIVGTAILAAGIWLVARAGRSDELSPDVPELGR